MHSVSLALCAETSIDSSVSGMSGHRKSRKSMPHTVGKLTDIAGAVDCQELQVRQHPYGASIKRCS